LRLTQYRRDVATSAKPQHDYFFVEKKRGGLMQFLSVDDLKNINYIANGKLVNQDQDSVLLSKKDVKQLLYYIDSLDSDVTPQVLGFLSKLNDFAK
jgi:hypothetical protein